jgi:hypothetical protein
VRTKAGDCCQNRGSGLGGARGVKGARPWRGPLRAARRRRARRAASETSHIVALAA